MSKTDVDTEIALLANLITYGYENFHEIAPLSVTADTFSDVNNQLLFTFLETLFDKQDVKKIDWPLIKSIAVSSGYKNWCSENEDLIDLVNSCHTEKDNVRSFAQKLKKLELAKNLEVAAQRIQLKAQNIQGTENLSEIFSIAETEFQKVSDLLLSDDEEPYDVAANIEAHVKNLISNQVDQMGYPTGFPQLDKYIGGGLRRHAITVIGARMKTGKSTLCKNIAYNIASQNIPVLYLDTEMDAEDQVNRLIASVANIKLNKVETGRFGDNIIEMDRVDEAIANIKKINFKYKNIAGRSIEEQLAIIKKWIIKNVGLHKNGKAKDCVLIYDYVKIMSGKELSNIQEHQALGFLMTTLQGLAVKYDIPILTAVQLNRDGISKEDTSAIGSSDRIAMYASAVAILKWKSPEEMQKENDKWGNQKLIPIISRYGPAMSSSDYINIHFFADTNRMVENGTSAESQNGGKNQVHEDVEF